LDPSKAIGVGTFGEINRDTGRFEPMGNIYNDKEIKGKIPILSEDACLPEQGQVSTHEYVVWTQKDSQWNFNLDPEVSLSGILDADAKLNFKLAPGKRSAFLIMDRFQTTSLPNRGFWSDLAKIEKLKDMSIVTDVMICSAYALGLTSKGSRSISGDVGLKAPIPVAAAVQAGGSVGGGWSSDASVSFKLKGSKLEDPKHYTALLGLKTMTPAWKRWIFGGLAMRGDAPSKPAEDDVWTKPMTPWLPLDEDGEEPQYYAGVPDSDEGSDSDSDCD